MDADYADDRVLFANTPTQAEFLLEPVEGCISLYVYANKTEYMRFNKKKKRDISTLNSGSLKLGDKFGRSVSSTEITLRLAKA